MPATHRLSKLRRLFLTVKSEAELSSEIVWQVVNTASADGNTYSIIGPEQVNDHSPAISSIHSVE